MKKISLIFVALLLVFLVSYSYKKGGDVNSEYQACNLAKELLVEMRDGDESVLPFVECLIDEDLSNPSLGQVAIILKPTDDSPEYYSIAQYKSEVEKNGIATSFIVIVFPEFDLVSFPSTQLFYGKENNIFREYSREEFNAVLQESINQLPVSEDS